MANFSADSLGLDGLLLIRPRKFADSRGFFMETYSAPAFAEFGVTATFVQDNHSLSSKPGTVRGLHFQTPPRAQAKLVRVARGAVFDVAVDLRRASPTYGHWRGARLTAEGGEQLFVPRGFAHGFCVLEPDTEVLYKVDDVYTPSCDTGLYWADPDIGVDWPVPAGEALTSDKDARLPRLADFSSPF